MKERPILFSAPMVRAILAGSKTQTRRALKVQPLDILPMKGDKAGREWIGLMQPPPEARGVMFRCKFGVPGDRLWVREAFMHEPADYCWEASVSIPCRPAHTVYRADFPECDQPQRGVKWSPSIHMPRNLSRILLEITAVHVERLNEISEADAKAEGVTLPTRTCTMYDGIWRDEYRLLWESINGAGSWDANPWVWVVEFRGVAP